MTTKDTILGLVKEYVNNAKKPIDTSVPVSSPYIDADDIAKVVSAALDGWFTEKTLAKEFEHKLQKYTGLNNSILCNSGSSAILLAMAACREMFSKRKYVLTSALAFPTTVFPIIQMGYTPLFVDIETVTLNPNPDGILSILQSNSSNIAGVILTHTLGFPIGKLLTIAMECEAQGIFFIEDCCDALGSTYDGKHVGTFGDAMTLSFFPAHHITTGEGGAVLSKHSSLMKEVRKFANWGRDCFPSDTPITTFEGIKYIQDINIGDVVVSHLGNMCKVYDLIEKSYTGTMVKIKPRMRPAFSVMATHPFAVLDDDGVVFWRQAKDLTLDDVLFEAVPRPYDTYGGFDWSFVTKHGTRVNHLDYDGSLFRLIGYWLSQGSLSKALKGKSGYKENIYYKYKVDFCFHKDKTAIIEDLLNLMVFFFGCKGQIRQDGQSKGLSISFTSRKAYEFFSGYCSTGALNKHVPYQLINLPISSKIIQLVWGFILGDGNRSFQGYSLSTISFEMLEQLRRILLQHGILTSSHVRTSDKHRSSIVKGKLIEQKHDLWNLNIYGKNAEKLAKFCDDDYVSRSNKLIANFNCMKNRAEYKISSLERYEVENLPVYNLEVEDDHSYHAWGIAVHNCWCIPGDDNTCKRRFDWAFEGLPVGYDHKYTFTRLGYNLKMTELQAALGVSQMDKLDWFVNARKENYFYLYNRCRADGFEFGIYYPDNVVPSPFGFPITVVDTTIDTRKVIQRLESANIRTRPIFAGNITRQPVMQDVEYAVASDNLCGTDYVMDRCFWVGIHPSLTTEQLDHIVEVFDDVERNGVN